MSRLVVEDIYSELGRRALVEAYTKSMWADGVHGRSRWLGVPLLQIPEDMVALAELVWETRPMLVVECGIWSGGGLVLYASILQLLGRGEVVGVDVNVSRALAVKQHPLAGRITLVQGSSTDAKIAAAVEPRAAGGAIVVVLDSNHSAAHVREELRVWSPLVRPGGYLVAMDGVMRILHDVPGGSARWRTDNPETAVAEFLSAHPEFERDPRFNRFGATHGPGGFLRRK